MSATCRSMIGTVTTMCRHCRKLVPGRIVLDEGHVWQERLCPRCGTGRALIADDPVWYARVITSPIEGHAPRLHSKRPSKGCPFDCGLCSHHAGGCNLPVFSVTNRCDLNCPICFTYNRSDRTWDMPLDEVEKVLDFVIAAEGQLDLINVTGGEPTCHPRIVELLERMTARPEIGRVTMNTNGCRLARDEELVKELARLGVYVILSFDTFDPERSVKIHGRDIVERKLRALELLEKHDVGTTLLNVMIRDCNEDEIGRIMAMAAGKGFIRSVTVQTMTYTGMGGGSFERGLHMTLDRAAAVVAASAGDDVKAEDFHPMPAAHPLCYSISYFFKLDGTLVPFRRLFTEEEIRSFIGTRYLIHPGDAFHERLNEAIHRLWAEGGDERILVLLKEITRRLYPTGERLDPFERQRRAEEHILTVYLHAHMDEDNFDTGRVSTCPDLVPDPSGTFVPACAYNLFYRQKDERFWIEPDPGEGDA